METTYNTLKELSELRLKESEYLIDNGFYDGGNYLLGYVIELALKARICKLHGWEKYPLKFKDLKTHEFDTLISLSGLDKSLQINRKDKLFEICWNEINIWNPKIRYEIIENVKIENIKLKLKATRLILNWIKKEW